MKKQVRRRIAQKYDWKRNPYRVLQRLQKKLLRLPSSRARSDTRRNSLSQHSYLGIDDTGRDVASELMVYAEYLQNRKVKLHTLLVLGSRAKGRAKPESDVDVLIIASRLPGKSSAELTNFAQKIMDIKRSFLLTDTRISIGIQPSGCCSKEEFLQWLHEFKILAWDAICYGKEVYDDGFWQYALKASKEIEEKYGLEERELKHILWVL